MNLRLGPRPGLHLAPPNDAPRVGGTFGAPAQVGRRRWRGGWVGVPYSV